MKYIIFKTESRSRFISRQIKHFFTMKKLLIASIVMFATLTACQNSESTVNPEEQQRQTFQSKTTSREGDVTDEKEAMAQAIEIIKKDVEIGGGSDSRILCHTSYSSSYGHACVQTGGHLFNVSWNPLFETGNPNIGFPVDDEFYPIIYTANNVSSCNCR